MNRDEKAAVVAEIAGQIQASEAVFAVDYRGLTVPQAAELRTKLRDSDASFRIVKNSLTELAADQAGAGSLKALLVGPTALTLVRGDAALAAKTLSDTARALRGILEFKGGLLNGSPLSAEQVVTIARLPSRQVLEAQLVGTIASPLVGLVRGLGGLLAGVAIQLGQILDNRAESAGADSGGSSGPSALGSSGPSALGSSGPSALGSSVAVADGGADIGAELPPAAEPSVPEAAAEPSEPEAAAEPSEPEPEPVAPAEPEPAVAAEPVAVAEPASESHPTTTTEEPDQDSASEDASDAKEDTQ